MNKEWLLCDFHIHTDFSDGTVPLDRVVDLFGSNGFDVISITDHILDQVTLNCCRQREVDPLVVPREEFYDYLGALRKEARRAWQQYRMLLIPGVEVTNNSAGYHIIASDIKHYVDPGMTVEDILCEVHRQEAIAIAAHPHRGSVEGSGELMYLWDNHRRFATLFDAWEVANGDGLFNAVGLKKFNYIANSDFHEKGDLYSWKTILRCEKNVESVKAEIRKNSNLSIYLFRQNKDIPRKRMEQYELHRLLGTERDMLCGNRRTCP
jgi:hypothetical protein